MARRLIVGSENFISAAYVEASMTDLPEQFMQECRATARRLEARTRHLLLLHNEGLYVLERWRTERHFVDHLRGIRD